MRLTMPDGSSVILVQHDEGVVVGTQGVPLANGDLPRPSGKLITGTDAEMLGALIEVIEDVETESVLGATG